ncbi:MAG: hypothetical protein O3C21_02815, partial [Verrucomicrobia bacterium]|nr:hypothetical protein [Verrucomicrobiota bacterium]
HVCRFLAEYELALDGFEVNEGAVLPAASALGDPGAVWVEEGGSWEISAEPGPTGEAAIVSRLGGGIPDGSANLLRWQPSTLGGQLRYWTRQSIPGLETWQAPSGGILTKRLSWERRSAIVRPEAVGLGDVLRFQHAAPGSGELRVEPVTLEETLDSGNTEGDGAVEVDFGDGPAGHFTIADGHDLAGNGGLSFSGNQQNAVGRVLRTYDGPGLLTFSWAIWAGLGETLTLRRDGMQLFRTASLGNFGYAQQSIRLAAGAGQELVWIMQYQDNPWNPFALDDIHYSTAVDASLVSALDLPGGTELFATAPFDGIAAARDAVLAQSATTHDGADAVKFDASPLAAGDPRERRTLTLPVAGPALVSYWARSALPLEASLVTTVSGERAAQSDDGTGDWRRFEISVPSGEQTVRWELATNGATMQPGDAAFLDEVAIFHPSGDVRGALDVDFADGTGAHAFSVPAAASDGEDSVVLFGRLDNDGGPQVSADLTGPGVLSFAIRGSSGYGAGSAAVVQLNGVFKNLEPIGYSWVVKGITLPPGSHTVQFGVTRKSELWLDRFVFTPARVTDFAEALDAPGLTFTAGPRAVGGVGWTALAGLSTSLNGEDAVILDRLPVGGGTADLRATIQGPARVSFSYRDWINVWIDNDGSDWWAGWQPSPAGGDWNRGHLLLPAGAHSVDWTATSNLVAAALDDLKVEPLAVDPVAAALDMDAGLPWTAYGSAPWGISTDPSDTRDGEDALVVELPGAGDSAFLRTSVEGPATVRFFARDSIPPRAFESAVSPHLLVRNDGGSHFLRTGSIIRPGGLEPPGSSARARQVVTHLLRWTRGGGSQARPRRFHGRADRCPACLRCRRAGAQVAHGRGRSLDRTTRAWRRFRRDRRGPVELAGDHGLWPGLGRLPMEVGPALAFWSMVCRRIVRLLRTGSGCRWSWTRGSMSCAGSSSGKMEIPSEAGANSRISK